MFRIELGFNHLIDSEAGGTHQHHKIPNSNAETHKKTGPKTQDFSSKRSQKVFGVGQLELLQARQGGIVFCMLFFGPFLFFVFFGGEGGGCLYFHRKPSICAMFSQETSIFCNYIFIIAKASSFGAGVTYSTTKNRGHLAAPSPHRFGSLSNQVSGHLATGFNFRIQPVSFKTRRIQPIS